MENEQFRYFRPEDRIDRLKQMGVNFESRCRNVLQSFVTKNNLLTSVIGENQNGDTIDQQYVDHITDILRIDRLLLPDDVIFVPGHRDIFIDWKWSSHFSHLSLSTPEATAFRKIESFGYPVFIFARNDWGKEWCGRFSWDRLKGKKNDYRSISVWTLNPIESIESGLERMMAGEFGELPTIDY